MYSIIRVEAEEVKKQEREGTKSIKKYKKDNKMQKRIQSASLLVVERGGDIVSNQDEKQVKNHFCKQNIQGPSGIILYMFEMTEIHEKKMI